MERTFTGSGPQLVSTRRLRKAILCSWMSFTSLWELTTIISYSSFSCIEFLCVRLEFYKDSLSPPPSYSRYRHKQGCVSQTLCRRGLFSLARRENLQSAWTSFCWVECLVSEPPILPHWLLLRDPRSPTPSKRSSLVLYHQHLNSHIVQLICYVKYSSLRLLFELLF